MECSIKERWFILVLLPLRGLLPGNGKGEAAFPTQF